ncbi:hypothetical protein [Scandinavium manionii]|nr:hypothetical protein [Scandinavium manionii]
MDNFSVEECEEVQWNGEFVPHVLVPADDEELEQLMNDLGM